MPPSPRTGLLRPLPPRVPWAELEPSFIRSWGQPQGKFDPEHLSVYGCTGSGKTYFISRALKARVKVRDSHVVYIVTKPADKTIKEFGWPVIEEWPPRKRKGMERVIFKATADGLGAEKMEAQREKIYNLLENIWVPEANIVVGVDEMGYLEEELKLGLILRRYFREARSQGITLVTNAQRPQGRSRLMHSETFWKVSFAPNDQDDALRVAEVLGDRKLYMEVLASLDPDAREFVIVHTRSRKAYISRIEE